MLVPRSSHLFASLSPLCSSTSPCVNNFAPSALQKKQARRSLAEINAFLEANKDDHDDDPDPQQSSESHQPPEHPMMAFINLMLKDLNVEEDLQVSNQASPESTTTSTSPPQSRSVVSRYLERSCLTKIVEFCVSLPDWAQLQALLRHYLWHVDWKFLITAQDLIETQIEDLWVRVILPAKGCELGSDISASVSRISLQPGDLSRLALLASVLGETIESMAPDAIAETMPIARQGVASEVPVKLGADENPRVKALLLLTYHIPALIEECVRLDELTLELVQANISAFSLWSNQGLHGTGSSEFPSWNVTIRAAKGCNLFEDPGDNGSYTQQEVDHRRRLAWLVYGYDHAFAVGANTKPLIVESQFSVDQPSDAAPWSACGAPPDPCLASLEVEGGKIAQLVSNTLCYGPPLHRKAMETDKKIMDTVSKVHPSYSWDNPDLSHDASDPFRARRRCWLQLTTAWQRGSLHRQFFFPNGRITNGELATSRHIATDSALRSITAVRELRKMQNRFSDYIGSAWWFQYLTEPCMTLATAALLLIRSRGQGVAGLSNEANCWPTVMHFARTIDECMQDLAASTRDAAACLPTFLKFAQGCLKLIQQLRSAVQASFDAFVKSQPELTNLKHLRIDENIIPLLHPRSRQKSPTFTVSTHAIAPGQGSESSGSSSSHATQKFGVKRTSDSAKRNAAGTRSRKSIGIQDHDGFPRLSDSSSQTMVAESQMVSPRTSFSLSNRMSGPIAASEVMPNFSQGGMLDQGAGVATGGPSDGSVGTYAAPTGVHATNLIVPAHPTAPTSPRHPAAEPQLPPGTLSLSFVPTIGFAGPAAPSIPRDGSNASVLPVTMGHSQQAAVVAAPHYGVPAFIPEGHLLSPAEPFALRDFYSDDGVQRANGGRGLAEWIASVQMDMLDAQQPHAQ